MRSTRGALGPAPAGQRPGTPGEPPWRVPAPVPRGSGRSSGSLGARGPRQTCVRLRRALRGQATSERIVLGRKSYTQKRVHPVLCAEPHAPSALPSLRRRWCPCTEKRTSSIIHRKPQGPLLVPALSHARPHTCRATWSSITHRVIGSPIIHYRTRPPSSTELLSPPSFIPTPPVYSRPAQCNHATSLEMCWEL